MRATATLKKISDHLNISVSTVSRALKDHPDVAPETKKRVKELAELMDYEPNAFAVNLRKKHSNIFAVIVPEINNFFYHSVIQAIEEEARKLGYSVMILQSLNKPELEKDNLRLCRHNHVAGVFISLGNSMENLDAFRRLELQDIPLVFVDKVPLDDNFNKVCIADYEAGALAAEKLLGSAREEILAVFGAEELSITERRKAGLTEYLQQHGPGLKIHEFNARSQSEAMTIVEGHFQRRRPNTAIFSMSDEIMCGTMKALNRLKMVLPNDAGLLTISNGFLPTLFSPEIDFVETNGYDLGKLSFDRMREILDGKKFVRENLLHCTYHAGGTL